MGTWGSGASGCLGTRHGVSRRHLGSLRCGRVCSGDAGKFSIVAAFQPGPEPALDPSRTQAGSTEHTLSNAHLHTRQGRARPDSQAARLHTVKMSLAGTAEPGNETQVRTSRWR